MNIFTDTVRLVVVPKQTAMVLSATREISILSTNKIKKDLL